MGKITGKIFKAIAAETKDARTVKQLTEYAAARGIDLGGASLKADIIKIIDEAEATAGSEQSGAQP